MQVNGFDDIFVETISLCCQYYEDNLYIVPKEKYMLLKASWGCGLFTLKVDSRMPYFLGLCKT